MAFPWAVEGRYSNPAEARIAKKSAEDARIAEMEKFAHQRVVQSEVAAAYVEHDVK